MSRKEKSLSTGSLPHDPSERKDGSDDGSPAISWSPSSFLPPSELGIGKLRRKLKQAERADVRNYLRSIKEDADYVDQVRKCLFKYPAFGNLRQGLWYSRQFDGKCYFKSNDGHQGQWDFSLSRLNLHVALSAATHAGCIIVDSTRQGKKFPDSLSKTIPIWCCVLNSLLAEERRKDDEEEGDEHVEGEGRGAWDTSLHLPEWVGSSERAQIKARIPLLLERATPARAIILQDLKQALTKPLRAVWICRDDILWETEDGSIHLDEGDGEDQFTHETMRSMEADDAERVEGEQAQWQTPQRAFTPIICVSASRLISNVALKSLYSWPYIQGAADDEESWAQGLSPSLFWSHEEELLDGSLSAEGAADLIHSLLLKEKAGECQLMEGEKCVTWIRETGIGFAPSSALASATFSSLSLPLMLGDEEVDLLLDGSPQPCSFLQGDTRYIYCGLTASKKEKNKTIWQTEVFPKAIASAFPLFLSGKGGRCVVTCETGNEVSAIIVLALLLAFFDEGLSPILLHGGKGEPSDCSLPLLPIDKEKIRAYLAQIQSVSPSVSFPRRFLKEVNNFFIPKSGPWFRVWKSIQGREREREEK